MAENKLYTKPGDRGDASNSSGIAGIKKGRSGTLQGECSEGYQEVKTGWVGNVKR